MDQTMQLARVFALDVDAIRWQKSLIIASVCPKPAWLRTARLIYPM